MRHKLQVSNTPVFNLSMTIIPHGVDLSLCSAPNLRSLDTSQRLPISEINGHSCDQRPAIFTYQGA